ncbi:MAG TPA: electron transfer flavoprotein subunit alpha/FixB family protein [Limnochordales bacterium]
MATVLAVVLQQDGGLPSWAGEVVTCAAQAARETGWEVQVAVVGPAGAGQPAGAPAGTASPAGPFSPARLGRAGARKVWQVAVPGSGDGSGAEDQEPVPAVADRLVRLLEALARRLEPAAVVLRGDAVGACVAPRLAWRLQAACVTDVVGVRSSPGGPGWVRPMYGGKAMAVWVSRRPCTVVAVRPRAFSGEPVEQPSEPSSGQAAAAELPVEVLALELPQQATARVRCVERRPAPAQEVRLEDARVVVSGGRGIGGPEGFQQLQELARLLGGAVGASRAAVDAGWVPATLQIGQTGRIVAPELYVAVGISGASQHLAGISGARHIVAINRDPEAPIFHAAEVGVVEDWRRVVPLLIQRLREHKAGEVGR